MVVPVVCQRQERIITTAQVTVVVCSPDPVRRPLSKSHQLQCGYAVRVQMRLRRAWRPQPGDDCSWTVLTHSLGPESSDDDRGAPDQFIDEPRRHRGRETQRDVYTQGC